MMRKRWSKFTGLMEAAVFLSELRLEEQRRLPAENINSECRLLRILAQEEEESRRRIFSHFPRKLRSSLEEPNLMDLNDSPTDSESTQSYDSTMEALQNPSSDESFSLPSLVEYNTSDDDDESEKTEMGNPINPNLPSSLSSGLTINTSRKRRGVSRIKRVSGVKKPEVVSSSSQQAERERPEWLVQVMENMKVELTEAKLIFEKCLFVTDVNPTQSRLSMPYNGLLQKDFLTDAELRIIEQDIGQKKKTGVDAILMNQKSKEWEVKLKRWEMKKDKENGSWNYSLVVGWNEFVKANGLKAGDNISVWSFRSSGLRYFALEKTS